MNGIKQREAASAPAVQVSACQLGAADRLDEAIAKAKAMVCMTYGTAGDSFREMAGNIQDDYLWAVHDRLHEAQAAANALRPPAMAPAPMPLDPAELDDFYTWLTKRATPEAAAQAAHLFEQFEADYAQAQAAWRKAA